MREWCWLKTLWFRLLHPLSQVSGYGHSFVETETHDYARVQVLTCRTCGQVHVMWEPTK